MFVVQQLWFFSPWYGDDFSRWKVYKQLLEMGGSSRSGIWAAGREIKGIFAERHGPTGLDTLPAVDNAVLCFWMVMGSIKCGLGGSWAAGTFCVGGSLFSPEKLNWLLFSLEAGKSQKNAASIYSPYSLNSTPAP